MTLNQFAIEMSQDIERFYKQWEAKQLTPEADNFPLEMEPGDWFEQFQVFISTEAE